MNSATRASADSGQAAAEVTFEVPPSGGPVAKVSVSDSEVSVADQVAEYLRTLDLVRQVLAVDEVTEESLRTFMAGLSADQQRTRLDLGQRLAELEEEIAQLRGQLVEQTASP